MIDIQALVPKDKMDLSGMDSLRVIDKELVEPILPALLEWMQDLHWPVAQQLLEISPRFHDMLVPHIHAVFQTDDDVWKNWMLFLLERFPVETVQLLAEDIHRIIQHPTPGELSEATNEYAIDTATHFGWL